MRQGAWESKMKILNIDSLRQKGKCQLSRHIAGLARTANRFSFGQGTCSEAYEMERQNESRGAFTCGLGLRCGGTVCTCDRMRATRSRVCSSPSRGRCRHTPRLRVMSPAAAADTSDYVGTDTCKACHEDIYNNYEKTPHWKTLNDSRGGPSKQGCEGCHGPGAQPTLPAWGRQ